MVSAIGKEFLFPHRHFCLHAVHGVGTGFKSGVTVGSGHSDDDAALANLKPANAVYHGNCPNGKFLLHLGADLGQLLFCHHGTVGGTLNEVIDLLHAQWLCRDFKHQRPPLTGGMSASSSPSAKLVSGSTKSVWREKRVLAT